MPRRDITLIAAMSSDLLIGDGDGMPWDVPEEYDGYRAAVRDAAVVFGRRSYEIFAADLDRSELIVLTRSESVDGVTTASGVAEALRLARSTGRSVYVAGGAKVYEAALPYATRMRLSTIHGDFAGDTRFPAFDAAEWRVEREEPHERYTLREYARVGEPKPLD